MEIVKFNYNDQQISFQPEDGRKLMVNATEMAKAFDKKVNHFLENEGTQNFINACLKSRNSGFLGIEKETDLLDSKQKSGTWMHRVLALKFAAWLNPDFEVWVYSTIENLIFGNFKRLEESLKQSAKRKAMIENLKESLAEDERFQELERLELEERQAAYRRRSENSAQLDLFKSQIHNT